MGRPTPRPRRSPRPGRRPGRRGGHAPPGRTAHQPERQQQSRHTITVATIPVSHAPLRSGPVAGTGGVGVEPGDDDRRDRRGSHRQRGEEDHAAGEPAAIVASAAGDLDCPIVGRQHHGQQFYSQHHGGGAPWAWSRTGLVGSGGRAGSSETCNRRVADDDDGGDGHQRRRDAHRLGGLLGGRFGVGELTDAHRVGLREQGLRIREPDSAARSTAAASSRRGTMSAVAPSSSRACQSSRLRVWAARSVASSCSNCGPVPALAATIRASSTPAPPANEIPTMSTYTVSVFNHARPRRRRGRAVTSGTSPLRRSTAASSAVITGTPTSRTANRTAGRGRGQEQQGVAELVDDVALARAPEDARSVARRSDGAPASRAASSCDRLRAPPLDSPQRGGGAGLDELLGRARSGRAGGTRARAMIQTPAPTPGEEGRPVLALHCGCAPGARSRRGARPDGRASPSSDETPISPPTAARHDPPTTSIFAL